VKKMIEDLVEVRVFRSEIHHLSDFALPGIVHIAANSASRFVSQSDLPENSSGFGVAHKLK